MMGCSTLWLSSAAIKVQTHWLVLCVVVYSTFQLCFVFIDSLPHRLCVCVCPSTHDFSVCVCSCAALSPLALQAVLSYNIYWCLLKKKKPFALTLGVLFLSLFRSPSAFCYFVFPSPRISAGLKVTAGTVRQRWSWIPLLVVFADKEKFLYCSLRCFLVGGRLNLINVDVTVLHYEGRPLQCRYFIDSFCSKDRRTESNLFVGGDALSHFLSVFISEFG